jgi:hypothetical protein
VKKEIINNLEFRRNGKAKYNANKKCENLINQGNRNYNSQISQNQIEEEFEEDEEDEDEEREEEIYDEYDDDDMYELDDEDEDETSPLIDSMSQ